MTKSQPTRPARPAAFAATSSIRIDGSPPPPADDSHLHNTATRPERAGALRSATAAVASSAGRRRTSPPDHRPNGPRLNPALRRVWRDPSTLQIGVDPDRAVIIDGLVPAVTRFLLGLDGRRSEDEAIADAANADLDSAVVADILAGLRRGGVLVDGAAPPARERPLERLEPDRAAHSLLVSSEEVRERFAARHDAQVVVHGAGRVGGPIASLLAAAGVGKVSVAAEGVVEITDCAPGGLSPGDRHRPRRSAMREALRRAAPDVDTQALGPSTRADLVIFTCSRFLDPDLRRALHDSGIPHLVAAVRETTGIVGPLVIPGRSSCTRCADLHRADRDSSWPLVSLQLTEPARRHTGACDVSLAATTAGVACMQALAHLDGLDPATLDGTLELSYPDWRVRRRSWPAHPDCDCRAADQC
jgi:hypothetical protein